MVERGCSMPAQRKSAREIICLAQAALMILPAPAIALPAAAPPKLQPLVPKLDTRYENSPSPAAPAGTGTALPPPSPLPVAPAIKAGQEGGAASPVNDLLRQAIAQHASGKAALAESTFKKILTMDPNNGDAHFSLGAIYEEKGDLIGAARHYGMAWRANPGDPEIQQAVTAVENKIRDQQQVQDKARQEQQRIAQQEQQRSDLKRLSDRAAQEYRKGNYDSAIRDLQIVLQQAPRDPDVNYAMAQAYRGKGNYEQARYYIAQAAAVDPANQMYQTAQHSIEQEAYTRSRQMASNAADNTPAGQITPIQSESSYRPGSVSESAYGWGRAADSSRLKRAVVRGLAGAAAGAALGALISGRGNVKSGAMRGALSGGFAGLMLGGF